MIEVQATGAGQHGRLGRPLAAVLTLLLGGCSSASSAKVSAGRGSSPVRASAFPPAPPPLQLVADPSAAREPAGLRLELLAPPATLALAQVAAYSVEVRLEGADLPTKIVGRIQLDDNAPRLLDRFPTRLPLSSLGALPPGEHRIVAVLLDERGRLLRGAADGSLAVLARFRVVANP